MPTPEQKDFIYSVLHIPADIPFSFVCKEYKTLYNPAHIQGKIYKTWWFTASCWTGCAIGGLISFFGSGSEDHIVSLREKRPYSSLQGKNFTYNFGGGQVKQYYINNRDAYEYMVSDVRATLDSYNANFAGGVAGLCSVCTKIVIPF